jgi:SAM-dependent methyltransferase
MPAAGRFCPGTIDYDAMSVRYQSGRALSEGAAKTWCAAVAPFIQASVHPRIVDLGAGTGRFAALCAGSLGATVVGIEPSTGMLAVAARGVRRGTFGDQLDGFPTLFQFWPATRQICEQLPTVQDTVAVFERSGFMLAQRRRIQQETASSLSEFAKRTRFRADSALMLISDAEFQEGQIAIEAAAARESRPVPVVEVIELLAFRNGFSRSAA